MTLAGLLIEIRSRARVLPPRDLDPRAEIMRRVLADPDMLENRTLLQIVEAIDRRSGELDGTEIYALGQEALGLLDALIERVIS